MSFLWPLQQSTRTLFWNSRNTLSQFWRPEVWDLYSSIKIKASVGLDSFWRSLGRVPSLPLLMPGDCWHSLFLPALLRSLTLDECLLFLISFRIPLIWVQYVLAGRGCPHKIPRSGWLKQQKGYSSQLWRLGKWREGIGRFDFRFEFPSWLADSCLVPGSSHRVCVWEVQGETERERRKEVH